MNNKNMEQDKSLLDFIPVYIIPESVNATKTKTEFLFTDPYFIVDIQTYHSPVGLQPTNNMTVYDQIEALSIQEALRQSRIKYPNSSVIVIKNSSVSNTSSSKIIFLYDLCYINRWSDKCQLYTKKLTIDETTMITTTQSPNGVQAIMYTPNGRDIILGLRPMKNGKLFIVTQPIAQQLTMMIYQGNISAKCIVPNLVEYNINDAVSNADYLKVQECDLVYTPEQTNINTVSFFWFFLILFLLIILGWCLLKIGPKA